MHEWLIQYEHDRLSERIAVCVISRPEERFFFIYDRCLLQNQDDDINKSVLYFDPKFVSSFCIALCYVKETTGLGNC